jgi:hypothetical protein
MGDLKSLGGVQGLELLHTATGHLFPRLGNP